MTTKLASDGGLMPVAIPNPVFNGSAQAFVRVMTQ
jgi:hypothetical protein